jgi:hypothetical protein
MAQAQARVSIKTYLVPYLRSVGEALGTDDLSEIVNHIITCNKLGCSTGGQPTTAQPLKSISASANNTVSSMTNTPTPMDDVSLADSLGDLFAA